MRMERLGLVLLRRVHPACASDTTPPIGPHSEVESQKKKKEEIREKEKQSREPGRTIVGNLLWGGFSSPDGQKKDLQGKPGSEKENRRSRETDFFVRRKRTDEEEGSYFFLSAIESRETCAGKRKDIKRLWRKKKKSTKRKENFALQRIVWQRERSYRKWDKGRLRNMENDRMGMKKGLRK